MAFLLFIGGIIALATFVTVLMMDPTDPFEPETASAPRPKPAPVLPPAPVVQTPPTPAMQATKAPRPKRNDPAFYEQIGRRTVVLPELEEISARSPYVVDLSKIDARNK